MIHIETIADNLKLIASDSILVGPSGRILLNINDSTDDEMILELNFHTIDKPVANLLDTKLESSQHFKMDVKVVKNDIGSFVEAVKIGEADNQPLWINMRVHSTSNGQIMFTYNLFTSNILESKKNGKG